MDFDQYTQDMYIIKIEKRNIIQIGLTLAYKVVLKYLCHKQDFSNGWS